MIDIFAATETFMRAGEQHIAEDASAGFPDRAVRDLRIDLLEEEVEEYFDKGEGEDDLIEAVDGLIDTIVVAYGTLLAYVGKDATHHCMGEVARSNLSKIVDGKLEKRDDGKVLKGPNYSAPDIAGILAFYGYAD